MVYKYLKRETNDKVMNMIKNNRLRKMRAVRYRERSRKG
jgi:hypothetical protein